MRVGKSNWTTIGQPSTTTSSSTSTTAEGILKFPLILQWIEGRVLLCKVIEFLQEWRSSLPYIVRKGRWGKLIQISALVASITAMWLNNQETIRCPWVEVESTLEWVQSFKTQLKDQSLLIEARVLTQASNPKSIRIKWTTVPSNMVVTLMSALLSMKVQQLTLQTWLISLKSKMAL